MGLRRKSRLAAAGQCGVSEEISGRSPSLSASLSSLNAVLEASVRPRKTLLSNYGGQRQDSGPGHHDSSKWTLCEIWGLVEDAPMRGCLLPPLRMTVLSIGCEGGIRFAANLEGEQCKADRGRVGTSRHGGIHPGEIF